MKAILASYFTFWIGYLYGTNNYIIAGVVVTIIGITLQGTGFINWAYNKIYGKQNNR